jgi:hypothetical protein
VGGAGLQCDQSQDRISNGRRRCRRSAGHARCRRRPNRNHGRL